MKNLRDLNDWQLIVVEEYNDLFVKQQRLGMFIGSPKILELPEFEVHLLTRQYKLMSDYLVCLETRIAAFT